MSIQAESQPIIEFTSISAPTLPCVVPDEFMDVGGRFTFRAYLGDAPPDDHAADIVAAALSDIVANGGSRSNEQLYDDLHSQLCGPEPMEQSALLMFLRLCARAIRQQIRWRAEASLQQPRPQNKAERPTFSMNSPTTVYLAEQFPEPTLSRLQLWETFSAAHPNAGLVYELSDFVGCTDEEIAQLLQQPPKRVKALRVQAFATIFANDPQ